MISDEVADGEREEILPTSLGGSFRSLPPPTSALPRPRLREGAGPSFQGPALSRLHPGEDPDHRLVFASAQSRALLVLLSLDPMRQLGPARALARLLDRRLAGPLATGGGGEREAWLCLLVGLDEAAQAEYGERGFLDCSPADQRALVRRLARGQLPAPAWAHLGSRTAWSTCMRSLLAAVCASPRSWLIRGADSSGVRS